MNQPRPQTSHYVPPSPSVYRGPDHNAIFDNVQPYQPQGSLNVPPGPPPSYSISATPRSRAGTNTETQPAQDVLNTLQGGLRPNQTQEPQQQQQQQQQPPQPPQQQQQQQPPPPPPPGQSQATLQPQSRGAPSLSLSTPRGPVHMQHRHVSESAVRTYQPTSSPPTNHSTLATIPPPPPPSQPPLQQYGIPPPPPKNENTWQSTWGKSFPRERNDHRASIQAAFGSTYHPHGLPYQNIQPPSSPLVTMAPNSFHSVLPPPPPTQPPDPSTLRPATAAGEIPSQPPQPPYTRTDSEASEVSTVFSRPDMDEIATPITLHTPLLTRHNYLFPSRNDSPSNGPPLSAEEIATWTTEKITSFLAENQFSKEWQEAFQNLNISGKDFIVIGQINGYHQLYNTIVPEVNAIYGANAKQDRERHEARRLKKLVRGLGPTKEPTGEDSPGKQQQQQQPSTQTQAQAQPQTQSKSPTLVPAKRMPNHRSSTIPANFDATSAPWNSTENLQQPQQQRSQTDTIAPRSAYSKDTLSSLDSRDIRRHSPSNSDVSLNAGSILGPPATANRASPIPGSPQSSPSPIYPTSAPRHQHSNSTDSVTSGVFGIRPEGMRLVSDSQLMHHKGKLKRSEGRTSFGHDSHEQVKERSVSGLFHRFGRRKNRSNTKEFDIDGSPTSPMGGRDLYTPPNMPYFSHHNGSDSSIDRLSSTSTVSEYERLRQRGMIDIPTASKTALMFFVTLNGKNFTLVNLTEITDADNVRKEICEAVGVVEWEAAAIYLTEIGQTEHEAPLTDSMLMLSRRHGDAVAGVKFHVLPGPRSTKEQNASPNPVGLGILSSPSGTPKISGLRQRSSSPHLSGRVNSDNIPRSSGDRSTPQPKKDPLAIATDRSPPSTGPQINITGPLSPPHFSGIQRDGRLDEVVSRIDATVAPIDMARQISSKGTISGDESPTGPQGRKDSIPIPSPDGTLYKDELFLEETLSRVAANAVASGDDAKEDTTNVAQTAGKESSNNSNQTINQQINPMSTKSRQKSFEGPTIRKNRKAEELRQMQLEREKVAGFSKVSPRYVDFDNPRTSPFEEKRHFGDRDEARDTLVPLRKAPPPPVEQGDKRTSPSLSYRKPVEQRRDSNGNLIKPMRKKSVSRSGTGGPEMLERGRRKAVQADGGLANSQIAASIANVASLVGAGLPIPFPRGPGSRPSTSGDAEPSDQSQQQSPPPKRSIASVNLENGGGLGGSPRSGGTPNSPGFTWGKGNTLFKIPDYSQGNLNDEPTFGGISPPISPGGEVPPLTFRDPRFRDDEIQFIQSPKFTSPPSEDDDSDEDLFAVPIPGREVKKTPKATPPRPPPPPETFLAEATSEEESDDDGLFAIKIPGRGVKSPSPKENQKQTFLYDKRDDEQPEEKKDAAKRVSFGAAVSIASPPSGATPATAGSDNNSMASPHVPEYEEGDDNVDISPSPVSGKQRSVPRQQQDDVAQAIKRESFNPQAEVWASRPPAETLVEHLDNFFPDIDLDQPIIEEDTIGQAIPEEGSSNSPPVSPYPEKGPTQFGSVGRRQRNIHDTQMVTADQILKPLAERNSVRRSGLGRMKSIRQTFKEAHDIRNRVPSVLAGGSTGPIARNSTMLRRKSTKMFGAKLVELTPGLAAKRAAASAAANAAQVMQDNSNFGAGVKRQATFKWFKGQLIGKGTYGRVYLGMNATTGEFLAVKQVEVSRTEGNSHLKEMIAALNQEIETMQHLDHSNIVQYLGFEKKEHSVSIFLEYISGGSVGSCLRKHGKFEEPVVRSLTRQTLDGLAYLHQEGILHRDLKADNILLDLDGTCKISDFGISKKTENIYGNDATNSMQGSVFWMAPEVIRPEKGQGYSAKIDIWSLGCVVLEMFCGRRPWEKEEAIGAIFKLGSERLAPPIPDDVSPFITPEAIAFLADCHTVEPSDRPTAETLLRHHPFCALDPHYNFLDTSLYQKIRGLVSTGL